MFDGEILPKIVQAFLTSVIFTVNILLAMRIVYRNWLRVFSAPLSFIAIFLAAYWFRGGLFYSYMWTMVSVYSFGVMLCLIYYNMSVVNYHEGKECSPLVLCVLGFLAGCSHEVISICLIAMVGIDYLLLVAHKKRKWTYIFKHTGLGMGYLLGFSAPGNFYRMKQSHDIISATFGKRLRESLVLHILAVKGTVCWVSVVCFAAAGVAVVLLIRKNKDKLVKIIESEAIPVLTGGGVSVVMWSLVSTRPYYGMDFWILIVYAILLRFIVELSLIIDKAKIDILATACAGITILCFIGMYSKELRLYSSVSLQRRILAKEAVENNIEQVEVPRFEDSLLGDRYSSDLNDQKQYNTAYYVAYYGTRLIIKDVE